MFRNVQISTTDEICQYATESKHWRHLSPSRGNGDYDVNDVNDGDDSVTVAGKIYFELTRLLH
jgi:hypothetical protein